MLEEALDYASRGWLVLPVHGINEQGVCTCFAGSRCSAPGKHPAISDWVNRATTNPESIKSAWGKQPRLNIGIATGSGSGFMALDVDSRHGGDDSLAELEAKHGPLPKTLIARSGSGGWHYLFKHEPGIGNKTGFKLGLDIRGEGGQIVVAPSRHWTGGTYKWVDLNAPILPMPSWLSSMLIKSEVTTSRGNTEDEYWRNLFAHGVGEGGRNDAVARLAGYFLRHRVDPLLVLNLIQVWNSIRVRPPLTDLEVEQTVNSVAGKELARIKKHKG